MADGKYNSNSILFIIAIVLLPILAMLGIWKLIEVLIFNAPWICVGSLAVGNSLGAPY